MDVIRSQELLLWTYIVRLIAGALFFYITGNVKLICPSSYPLLLLIMTDDQSLAPTKQSTDHPQEEDTASRDNHQLPLSEGSPPSDAASTQVNPKSVNDNSTLTEGTPRNEDHGHQSGPYAVTPHSEMVASLGGPGTDKCRKWSKTDEGKKLFHDSWGFWPEDEAE